MRILDSNNNIVENPDLSLGKLVNENIFIAHHDAIEPIEEQWHYEVVREYPNGGKDVEKVIDVEGVEAQDAWDEYEDIQRYILFTETELILRALKQKKVPLSSTEILEMLLPLLINKLEVEDDIALKMTSFYPEWKEGEAYEVGFKVRYEDALYKVLQAHTSQAGWEPGVVMSLFAEINEINAGTKEDPIEYNKNMALENGKYYFQDEVIYLCNRDTINPVYNDLKDLVGLYVETI